MRIQKVLQKGDLDVTQKPNKKQPHSEVACNCQNCLGVLTKDKIRRSMGVRTGQIFVVLTEETPRKVKSF